MTMSTSVGIIACETYIPRQFVSVADLEKHDQCSSGKYTVGLGVNRLSTCADLEDINSICLTVTRRLIERNAVRSAKTNSIVF